MLSRHSSIRDDKVARRMVKREAPRIDLLDDRVDRFIELHLDLSAFLHILELTDTFSRFHDPDHDDKSRTYAVRFFELHLDRWSAE